MPLRQRPAAQSIRPAPPRESEEEPIRPTGPEPAPFEELPGDVIRPPRTPDEEARRKRKPQREWFVGRRDQRTILSAAGREDKEA
jgi:hypothetical protein